MPKAKPVVYKVKVRDAITYILIKDHPCKILQITTPVANEKHLFVAIDIFSGKVFKAIFPLFGTCLVPRVTHTDYQLVDISDTDPYVTVLDDKGNIKDDLERPTDKALLSKINSGIIERKDVYVTVVSALGKEKIIASNILDPE
ncbi:eukaryotic translation initiation factor 5A-4-like isoform X1 [Apium graveolens]